MTVRLGQPLAATGAALVLGFLVSTSSHLAAAFVVGVLGLAALGAPASAWLAAALVATLTFKGLGTIGVLPSVATFADMFLVWGALASAGLRRRRLPATAAWPARLLVALGLSMAVSGAFNDTELLRPVVYLMLLATPFVAATALLVDPPDLRGRRSLNRVLLVLLAVQVPLAYWQALTNENKGRVEGTLIGAGAGAHVMSAVAVVGAIWVLAAAPLRARARVPLAAALLVIPFLADAKQVILASPAMLLAGNWRNTREAFLRVGAVALAVLVLLTVIPAGQNATGFLEQAREGRGGKQAATTVVWSTLRADPVSMTVGVGPAMSISRAAFMTTPDFVDTDSPLHVLGLRPAELAPEVQARAEEVSGGYTSFDTGLSSALGVLGDIGVLGAAVYVALLGWFFVALRRSRSPEAVPATCGLALFAVLGLVFDWWEQPPFGILVGVLAGLALAPRARAEAGSARR
jgi:hypothetical protein